MEEISQINDALTGSSVFRMSEAVHDTESTPSVRVEGSFERTLDELNTLEPNFTEHQAITGLPFTASYLRLDKVYPHLTLEHQVGIKKIDAHIQDQIRHEHLQDTAEVARNIIRDLERAIGITSEHDPYYRIERLSNYLSSLTDYNRETSLRTLYAGQRNRDAQGRFI